MGRIGAGLREDSGASCARESQRSLLVQAAASRWFEPGRAHRTPGAVATLFSVQQVDLAAETGDFRHLHIPGHD